MKLKQRQTYAGFPYKMEPGSLALPGVQQEHWSSILQCKECNQVVSYTVIEITKVLTCQSRQYCTVGNVNIILYCVLQKNIEKKS